MHTAGRFLPTDSSTFLDTMSGLVRLLEIASKPTVHPGPGRCGSCDSLISDNGFRHLTTFSDIYCVTTSDGQEHLQQSLVKVVCLSTPMSCKQVRT